LVSKVPIKKQAGAHETSKGLSQDTGRAKLADNLSASLFNKQLWNETTFSLICLAG
jgi:hypothetical protein